MINRKIKNVIIAVVSVVFIFQADALFASQTSNDKTTKKEVKQEVADAAEAIKEYTVDQRDQALKKVKSILNDLDKRIDKLENKIDNKKEQMTSATRQKIKGTLKNLREQRNEVAEWYGGLKHSSADAWEEMKKGFSNAFSSFVDAWNKAVKEFGAGKK